MNILYLAHRIPYPPDKGDKLRSFRQLAHLSRKHRVWCVCFVDNAADWKHVETLQQHCHKLAALPLRRTGAMWRCAVGLVGGRTITEAYYDDPGMDRAIEAWTEEVDFDVVVAFSSSMAPFASRVPAPRHVLDMCDLDSQKWLAYAEDSRGPSRWFYATEGRRLAKRESQWVRQFDATILITQAEADAATSLDEPIRKKLRIVGNGVALPVEQTQAPSRIPMPPAQNKCPSPPTVGFVGVMDYRPNVDAVCRFVHQCWPGIHRAVPDATFRIVGRSPTPRVTRLSSTPGVVVVGSVVDVQTELREFDVSVAPMRIARGLQNKVLEAMAAGKPVVLTGPAAEGLNARHDRDFIVADEPDDIANNIITLLRNPKARHRVGQAARAYVTKHHDWETELQAFEQVVIGKSGHPNQSKTALFQVESDRVTLVPVEGIYP